MNAGADPNCMCGDKLPLLTISVVDGDARAIKLLLRYDADPGWNDSNGYTALDYSGEGTTDEASALIERATTSKHR